MSGPKVINIEAVRRRQKRESQVLLRRLQLVLADCERWQAQPQAEDSLMRLEILRDSEQWESLLLEAGRLHDFYQEESHRLRQQQAADKAAKLRRSHRRNQAVTQMKMQLRNLPPAPERDALLAKLANSDFAEDESALNAALDLLEEANSHQNNNRLRDLAACLIDGEAETDTPVRPSAPGAPHRERLEKCWRLLGELSADAPCSEIEALSAKAREVVGQSTDHRVLLLDSLALELSALLQRQRAARRWNEEVEILLTELEEIRSPSAEEWKQRLAASRKEAAPFEVNEKIVDEARAWIDQTIADENREEQHGAVLKALAAIGYEVREGMATAWVEQGRIVLRKADESSYGVELTAPTLGSTLQTRVVAFTDSGRDPQRDLEVEETWCDEFEKARADLSRSGFEANLLQAHPVGTIPLKTVETAPSVASHRQTQGLLENKRFDPRN
ncbi:MAG: hypothetical protein KDM63_04295 [Verrucomicrobiae bacterium]|nr:hypothetical protein [Verrucomicrobiae bacterium]